MQKKIGHDTRRANAAGKLIGGKSQNRHHRMKDTYHAIKHEKEDVEIRRDSKRIVRDVQKEG